MAWCTVKSYALLLFKFIVLCLHHSFFFIASQEQTGTVAAGSDNIGGKKVSFLVFALNVLLFCGQCCIYPSTLRRLMSYIYGAPILDVSR